MCEHNDITLNPGTCKTAYISGEYHNLLGLKQSVIGKNVGGNGENLTIAVLSLNRSVLTIKMMNSIAQCIPDFAGELLIIDNGSSLEELNCLKQELAKMPYRCRIVELGQNYGVAGGRNRTMQYVNTDWVMCLDNDIYFIGNPLKQVQKEISRLGCHFLNLPLLDETGRKIFALGGHLYLYADDGNISVGGGSAYKQLECEVNEVCPGFLSTFLFGGASIINKHTFNDVGGYDEGMFIGFEDIDFSINLFKKGLKIGNCGVFSLVHDHKRPNQKTDQDYERERFSEKILKESAEYFEKKHEMKVWNDGVSSWLKEKHKQLGLTNQEDSNKEKEDHKLQNLKGEIKLKTMPKIALVTDTDNWAFANISKQLKRYLSNEFEFKIIPMSIINDINQVLMLAKDCDLIHFFWRTHVSLINSNNIRAYTNQLGISYEKFYERFAKNLNLTTSVYDHLFLDDESVRLNEEIYRLSSNYYVSSKKLYDIYSNLPFCPKPQAILEDGVDLELFKPINIERLNNIRNREVVIGWSGNSKWADDIEDFKGVNTILKPALKELIEEGYPIRTFFADRAERMIPHNEMINYYSKIDVYICTSKIEGTPNPVLESMACGVPIISTDVGIVPQAFGHKQKEFILKERSVECLKEAIKNLICQPNLFKELSNENLQQIKNWDWSVKTLGFKQFFYRCINKS